MIHYSMAHQPVAIVDSFLQDTRALPILHDTTYLQVFLLLCGHGLQVFLADAVSILDISSLVLAEHFRLRCHLGNSSFHHLLEHDLLLMVRGTQRQFSENICSENDLRSRIFGTFVVKFLAYEPVLGFSNILKMI